MPRRSQTLQNKPGMLPWIIVGLLAAIGWPNTAVRAATLSVTSLADSGPGSLRSAIDAADPRDTINFAVSGTITLKSHATLMFDLPITQGSAKNSTLLIKAAGVNPHVPSSPTVSITLDGNYHPTTMSGTGSQTIDGAVYTFTWEATFVAPPPEPPTPAAL